MISDPVLVFHFIFKTKSHIGQHMNGLENRKAVRPATAQIIHFSDARILEELQKERSDIASVYLIANLLGFVAIYLVWAAGDRAHHDVSQITVQLHGRVLRPGQAAAAK